MLFLSNFFKNMFFFVCVAPPSQMLGDSLRGEMSSTLTGTQSSLRSSTFIKVMAKFISLNCKEVNIEFTLMQV